MAHIRRALECSGVLFLITFATSIPALLLFQPILEDPVGLHRRRRERQQIFFGALLELLLIVANIGTAVVIFPIVRRQSEELALGYVTARLVECTSSSSASQPCSASSRCGRTVAGCGRGLVAYTLAAIKDWTFLLGPGLVVGWGNGLILGYLMYRSGLVPRPLALLGLVGGPLHHHLRDSSSCSTSSSGRKCGADRPHHPRVHLGAVARHLLTVKGFKPGAPIIASDTQSKRAPHVPPLLA